MDLSAPISYNGLTLQPATAVPGGAARSGWEINDIDFSTVDVTGYTDAKALQDGLDAADVYQKSRTVTIQAEVLGASKGEVWDYVQEFLDAFNPRIAYDSDTASKGFLPLAFRQPTIDTATWTAGYIDMEMLLRPAAPPRYSANRLKTADGGRGFSVPVSAQMLASDPRKYVIASSTYTYKGRSPGAPTISYDYTQTVALSTATAALTYRGTYPVSPLISVSISTATATAFTITFTKGSAQSFVVSINAATLSAAVVPVTYVLNLADRTLVVASTGEDRSDAINATSTFGEVSAGWSAYTSSAAAVTATLYWREAFA